MQAKEDILEMTQDNLAELTEEDYLSEGSPSGPEMDRMYQSVLGMSITQCLERLKSIMQCLEKKSGQTIKDIEEFPNC